MISVYYIHSVDILVLDIMHSGETKERWRDLRDLRDWECLE